MTDTNDTNEAPATGIESIKDVLLHLVRAVPTSPALLADLERVVHDHFGDKSEADQEPAQEAPEATETVSDAPPAPEVPATPPAPENASGSPAGTL